MNLSKQARNTITLSLALVILLVVAIITVSANKGPSVPKTTPTKARKPAETAAKTAAADSLAWVDNTRLNVIVSETQGGRDPFTDLLMPAAIEVTPSPRPTPLPIPRAGEGMGTLPGSAPFGPESVPLEETVSQGITLKWIDRLTLVKALEKEGLAIDVQPGKSSGQVTLKGYQIDVEQAAALAQDLDKEPPVPAFVLTGIITTATSRFAVITVEGQTYSLYEGETVPGMGWTVARIAPVGVTLTKGKQSVPLRLTGGKV